MARTGITQIVLSLTNDEMRQTWENVRSHYGKEYSNSHVLYDLVRIKSYEIDEKMTNRTRLNRIDAKLQVIIDKLEG